MFRSSFRDRWKIEGSCPVIFSLLIFCKDCEDVGSIRHCGKVRLSNYGYLCKFEFFGAHK